LLHLPAVKMHTLLLKLIILTSFLSRTPLPLVVIVLFIAVLLFYYLGVKIGDHKKLYTPQTKAEGIGPLEGALLGLLALLLSFTFGMSATRFDARRTLITKEATDISAVIFLSDMYPDSIRSQFMKDMKDYVDERIAYYNVKGDEPINQSRLDAQKISDRIWERAIMISKKSPEFVRDSHMIPAINAMQDIVEYRDAARLATVPDLIIYLLFGLTILGGFIVGYGKKEKKSDWIVLALYSVMTVLTIYTILDLDRPRSGIIKTVVAHQKIDELRNQFK